MVGGYKVQQQIPKYNIFLTLTFDMYTLIVRFLHNLVLVSPPLLIWHMFQLFIIRPSLVHEISPLCMWCPSLSFMFSFYTMFVPIFIWEAFSLLYNAPPAPLIQYAFSNFNICFSLRMTWQETFDKHFRPSNLQTNNCKNEWKLPIEVEPT